ncbi:MAG: DUF2490 domain-containing protein [Saprospiraceae bacterium]|nr:DUF2490 domain-containing protein [Saprospiraceae bacterium]
MPVPERHVGRLCYTLLLALSATILSSAQTLVGGSLFAPAPAEVTEGNKLWLQYQNSFMFKDRLFIDTDFGHIFNASSRAKRLNIRSVFKYQLTDNIKIGTGMGFFWHYDRPDLEQELRFVQEINYRKNFGASILYQDLRLEERISQGVVIFDDYQTRVRYRLGITIPTNGAMYFGAYDEIFKNLSQQDEVASSFFSMNRAGVLAGFNTYQRFRIEAHLMMEDRYHADAAKNERSFIFTVMVKQII